MYVGAAAIVLPDVDAGIDIIHLVDKVLTSDASFNTTMIAAAEKLMGFGPFNRTQVPLLTSNLDVWDPSTGPRCPS